jgi:hypothetical protein
MQESNINKTLAARGAKYGTLAANGVTSQNLKNTMRKAPGWCNLTADKQEALDMIQHKISRILNGDPEYNDNWHDICGYAKLVEDEINAQVGCEVF